MPGLPGRVHLVAQAPQLHAVGLGVAVGRTFIGDARAGRQVAVLEELRCLLRAGGPQVDRHHRFGPDLPAPGHELVGAELVRLDRPPREVGAPGPLIERSHTVAPVVVRHEVPTRVPHHRHAQWSERVDHVAPQAALIAQRAAGIEHPLVDRPAHVFQEAGEDPFVDRGDPVLGVKVDLRLVRDVVEALRCVHGWLQAGTSMDRHRPANCSALFNDRRVDERGVRARRGPSIATGRWQR